MQDAVSTQLGACSLDVRRRLRLAAQRLGLSKVGASSIAKKKLEAKRVGDRQSKSGCAVVLCTGDGDDDPRVAGGVEGNGTGGEWEKHAFHSLATRMAPHPVGSAGVRLTLCMRLGSILGWVW